ncbi:hypothetical protein BJX68DRAFT_83532 [Aspergillus pseudodeflectus]|uniref:Secreted protein n=1 Tax=Aspergillus pseudodeflectus TaxID=176178 RepID=A0ABR4L747_9EURO
MVAVLVFIQLRRAVSKATRTCLPLRKAASLLQVFFQLCSCAGILSRSTRTAGQQKRGHIQVIKRDRRAPSPGLPRFLVVIPSHATVAFPPIHIRKYIRRQPWKGILHTALGFICLDILAPSEGPKHIVSRESGQLRRCAVSAWAIVVLTTCKAAFNTSRTRLPWCNLNI